VLSTQDEYNAYWKKAKLAKPDLDAVYVCPMALHGKRCKFVEMDWKEVYRGKDTDFDGIKQRINAVVRIKPTANAIKRKRDKNVRMNTASLTIV